MIEKEKERLDDRQLVQEKELGKRGEGILEEMRELTQILNRNTNQIINQNIISQNQTRMIIIKTFIAITITK